MTARFYQVLQDAWVEECVYRFGRVLPINFIEEGVVGYRVTDGDAPLPMKDGEPVRVFRLTYDYGRAIDERTNIN